MLGVVIFSFVSLYVCQRAEDSLVSQFSMEKYKKKTEMVLCSLSLSLSLSLQKKLGATYYSPASEGGRSQYEDGWDSTLSGFNPYVYLHIRTSVRISSTFWA